MKLKLNLVREFYNHDGDVEDADVEELVIDGDDLDSLVNEFPNLSQSYLIEDDDYTNLWLSTDIEQNFRTDEVESQSLHFTRGQSKEAKQLWREAIRKHYAKL